MTKENLKTFADSINQSEADTQWYVKCVTRVMLDNFSKDLASGSMTIPEAIEAAVKLWDKKHTDMCMQLLQGMKGADKMNLFADATRDIVYDKFNS